MLTPFLLLLLFWVLVNFFPDQSEGSAFAGMTAFRSALIVYPYYFLDSPKKENASFPQESVICSASYALFSLW